MREQNAYNCRSEHKMRAAWLLPAANDEEAIGKNVTMDMEPIAWIMTCDHGSIFHDKEEKHNSPTCGLTPPMKARTIRGTCQAWPFMLMVTFQNTASKAAVMTSINSTEKTERLWSC